MSTATSHSQSVICSAYKYLCFIDDQFENLVGTDHDECRRALNFNLGRLEIIHVFMHQGVILSEDMDNEIYDVLSDCWEWCEDHDVTPSTI